MSRRGLALGLSFAALLSLSLSVARGQETTASPSTSAPTTAPEPMVNNPHYLAWADYKPGTQVHLDMNVLVGGQQMTSNVIMTLNAVSPERAIVQSVAKLSIPGVPAQDQKQTHAFNAKVPKSVADGSYLPPGGAGETTDAGSATIEAAGKIYDTTIHEFNGTVQGAPATGKMWRSDDVPGGLVKMESTSGNMKVEMILKKVTEK